MRMPSAILPPWNGLPIAQSLAGKQKLDEQNEERISREEIIIVYHCTRFLSKIKMAVEDTQNIIICLSLTSGPLKWPGSFTKCEKFIKNGLFIGSILSFKTCKASYILFCLFCFFCFPWWFLSAHFALSILLGESWRVVIFEINYACVFKAWVLKYDKECKNSSELITSCFCPWCIAITLKKRKQTNQYPTSFIKLRDRSY